MAQHPHRQSGRPAVDRRPPGRHVSGVAALRLAVPAALTPRLVVAAVALLVVAGLVGWAALSGWGRSGDGSATSLARPTPSPGSQAVFPPAGAPEVGVHTSAVIGPEGSHRVNQWVLTGDPVDELVVSLPRSFLPSGGGQVGDLRVEAGGYAAVARDGSVGALDGEPERFDLAEPARRVRLGYLRDGNTEESSTRSTRALVDVTPLTVGPATAVRGPSVIRVRAVGGDVLSLTCTRSATSTPRPCGSPAGAGWTVRLRPGRTDVVTAQVDLPPAREG